jgi:type I restriction enzyme S subunit
MGTEPRYFGYLFRIPAYMGEVDRCSRGIVKDRNRLYWEDFKQIPSPCPLTTEQARIADAIVEGTQAIENTVEQVQGEISLLREYRTRLIADVVSGKLDVRGVELPELDEAEALVEQDEEVTVEDVNLDSESDEEDLAAEV